MFTIFEIKSKCSFTQVHAGSCQLLSFGLSVRYEKKITRPLFLILMTPTNWFVTILSPYDDDKLPNPIDCFSIIMVSEDRRLYRDNLIWMLKLFHIAFGIESKERSHVELLSHILPSKHKTLFRHRNV